MGDFLRVDGAPELLDVPFETTVINHGPDTLSYASATTGSQDVTQVTFSLTLAKDASVTLTGSTWLRSAGRSRLFVEEFEQLPIDVSVDTASRLAMYASAAEDLLFGALTRDSIFGTVTSAAVTWPDGATGAYTATLDVNGNVASYTITHVLGGTTKTFTQPTMTRDANGAVTTRPAITVT